MDTGGGPRRERVRVARRRGRTRRPMRDGIRLPFRGRKGPMIGTWRSWRFPGGFDPLGLGHGNQIA